jgi:glutamate carboxypeptidase
MTGLLAAARSRIPEFLADLERLVSHESPSHDPAAITASATLVRAIGLERLGTQGDLIVVDGCAHVRWRFGSGPRRVVILAHHDTVWPVGTIDRIPWRVADGVITGPGCFDMKFGIAQAFQAIAILGASQLDGVTLLVTGDEEVGSPRSRELIEAEAAGCAGALVLEGAGPGGALKTERKGVSLYEVLITGRAAHAGLEPENGVNAGVELAHQVLAISTLGNPELGTTVTPTTLVAGTTTNTVPAAARISVDARARTATELLRVDSAIRALGAVVPGSLIRVLGGPNRWPLELVHSEAMFVRAVGIAGDLGVPAPRSVAVGGASDGNFTGALGVPTLDGLGAVGGGAHADDEHVLVDCVADRIALLAGLIESLVADPVLETGAGHGASDR